MRAVSFSSLLTMILVAAPGYAGDIKVLGEAMPAGDAQPVSAAIAAGVADETGPRKFSGRITEVCQTKGCWVMLEHEGQVARVMMKDHSFFVPKDARGEAVVYGTLSEKTLDEKMAKHLAEDAGRSEPVALREYRIVALSIALPEA